MPWLFAPTFAPGATQRLFSTSSVRRDDDANPWAEIDESVDRLASSPAAELDSSSGDASDLSAEERMLLQAFTAKLDHLDAKQKSRPRPPPTTTSDYFPAPRVHHPAPPPPPPATRTTRPPPRLTHLEAATQQPRMVDVSSKSSTHRSATASGKVFLPFDVLPLLTGSTSKGDITSPSGKGPVFSTARLAGVLAAKRTDELVPLCHTLPLDGVDVQLELVIPPGWEAEEMDADDDLPPRPHILITATCTTRGPTGVEMEALTAVSMAAVTVWDMLKSVAGREMEVGEIAVVAKSGGKSGDWVRTVG